MSREIELKQRVRDSGNLIERLKESRLRIAKMCSERRGPRMSIPVEWNDDDFYICLTLEDAFSKLSEPKTVTLDGETGIHVACGPAGQDAKQFSGRDVQEMTAIAFALRRHREAKEPSATSLLPSDRNPLLDAISWLADVSKYNGNYQNAQATMAHLTGMVGRLRNAATKTPTQCDHGVSLSIPCELCSHPVETNAPLEDDGACPSCGAMLGHSAICGEDGESESEEPSR